MRRIVLSTIASALFVASVFVSGDTALCLIAFGWIVWLAAFLA